MHTSPHVCSVRHTNAKKSSCRAFYFYIPTKSAKCVYTANWHLHMRGYDDIRTQNKLRTEKEKEIDDRREERIKLKRTFKITIYRIFWPISQSVCRIPPFQYKND